LMTRFQWVAAAGAGVLIVRSLLRRQVGSGEDNLGRSLMLGLLLLAIGAHDALGLGQLATVLLLIELVLSNLPLPRRHWGSAVTRLLARVGRSGWPPAVRFAGVTLALIAALQTSLAWGLLAALLLVGLKVVPIVESQRQHGQREGGWAAAPGWLQPAISLACGLAPALLLRMLHV
jgi:hypothetical protein